MEGGWEGGREGGREGGKEDYMRTDRRTRENDSFSIVCIE
jgi:hypothetical protein